MTDLEWDQYVEKLARKLYIPQFKNLKQTNSSLIKLGFNWKTLFKPPLKKVQNIEPRTRSKPKIKTTPQIIYITKTYLYEGRTYTRKFVGAANAK